MSEMTSPSALRTKLLADAAFCLIGGALLVLAAGSLAPLVRLPRPLLFWVGVILLPVAAANAWLGLRLQAPRRALLAMVLWNALWAIDSVLAVVFEWVPASLIGTTIVLAQALAIALLAYAEYHDISASPFRT
jgi:hypothetical protein